HRTRRRAFELARSVGLLAAILPPLAHLSGDDWDRTLLVLDHLPDEPSFPLALAGLLNCLAPSVANELGQTLRLANAERQRAVWWIEHESPWPAPRDRRPAALKRLLASQGVEELLQLHRAIARATSGDDAHVAYCEWYRREQPDGPLDPPP